VATIRFGSAFSPWLVVTIYHTLSLFLGDRRSEVWVSKIEQDKGWV